MYSSYHDTHNTQRYGQISNYQSKIFACDSITVLMFVLLRRVVDGMYVAYVTRFSYAIPDTYSDLNYAYIRNFPRFCILNLILSNI